MEQKSNRNIQFHFYANEQEAELIQQRMEASGIRNTSAFLRKMAIDGYHINLDLSDVKEMVRLMGKCSSNLNQYALRANQSGSVYAADIEDLKEQFDRLWDVANTTLSNLAKLP